MYAGEAMDPISLFEIDVFGRFWAGFQQRPFHPNPQKSSFSTQRKDFDFDSTHLLLPNSVSAASVSNTVQFNLEGNAIRLSRTTKGNLCGSSIKVLVPRAKAKAIE